MWGHSQGGHAALFTGQEAARYAPELTLVGVAAAAPATDLIELFDADHTTIAGKTLTAMALLSWHETFALPLDAILAPKAKPGFERVARDCIQSISEMLKIEQDTQSLQTNFLTANPTEVEPWKSIMARNSPGAAPAGAPVFIAQGTDDDIVRPAHHQALCRPPLPQRHQGAHGASRGRLAQLRRHGQRRCGGPLDGGAVRRASAAERLPLSGPLTVFGASPATLSPLSGGTQTTRQCRNRAPRVAAVTS